MDRTDFIVGLMKENTDALGFIPRPTIVKQFIRTDRIIIQRNRYRKAIGYLLHGPVHPDGHLIIHQACIRLDKRCAGFGRQALSELLTRAARARALTITLRCAWDLEAIAFWFESGFTPVAIVPGGKRRRRSIVSFRRALRGDDVDAGQPDRRDQVPAGQVDNPTSFSRPFSDFLPLLGSRSSTAKRLRLHAGLDRLPS